MMTGFRARAAFALAVMLWPAATAMAQQQAPLRLLPVQPTQEAEPAAPEEPAAAEAEAADAPGIMVQDLGQVDADSVGTMDASAGGLGLNMWSDTPRALIERLLADLPDGMRSPAMRDLTRRVLLSTAVIPRPSAADGATTSLIGMRVQHLMDMGLIEDATALIAIAPRRDTDPALLKARVNARLMAFDLAGACSVGEGQADLGDDPFWQKIRVFCSAVEGNVGAAQLGAAVLEETDPDPDPVFFSLIDRLTGEPSSDVNSLPNPEPLQLAMMRTARLELPGDVLTTRTPALLRTVGISPNAPLALRLEAAEEAAAVGAISPPLLAEIYGSVPFLPRELESPLSAAAEEPGPRSRALLYRAASIQEEPEARAAILERAVQMAREENVYPLIVRVHSEHLTTLEPAETLWWFAEEAARALYALGEPARADAWIAMLRSEAVKDETAREAADRLWALAQLLRDPVEELPADAGVEQPASAGATPAVVGVAAAAEAPAVDGAEEAWRAALIASDPERGRYRVSLAYVVLQALGHEVDQETWRMLVRADSFTETPIPDVSVRRAMAAAADAGGRGETALLALLALGAAGPATADSAVLADVLADLNKVGLSADARALAMETVIDAGL